MNGGRRDLLGARIWIVYSSVVPRMLSAAVDYLNQKSMRVTLIHTVYV